MRKVIYKYPLKNVDFQTILLPYRANIISIQAQFNQIQLWAEVDYESTVSKEERHIELHMTGEPYEVSQDITRKYISTVQTLGGNYVLHAFELMAGIDLVINKTTL